MKNISIHLGISFLHFSILWFSILFVGGIMKIDLSGNSNYVLPESYQFYALLTGLGMIGVSLFGIIIWQTNYFLLAKIINILLSLLFVISSSFILLSKSNTITSNDIEPMVGMLMIFLIPSILLFLLTFSKSITQNIKIKSQIPSLSLDSDFIVKIENQSKNTHFLKINRIIGLCFLLVSLLLLAMILLDSKPLKNYILPAYFLFISLLLFIFPKIGSYITSLLNTIIAIILFVVVPILLYKDFKKLELGQIKLVDISLYGLGVFIAFFLLSLSLLLVSKQAQSEWKK